MATGRGTGTRIGVIGAGIVGLAVARSLQERLPDSTVVVLEKEDRVARHQTGHNSGVIHAGIYYAPGSLKAGLCRRGRQQLLDLCQRHSIPVDVCGKLIVARDRSEVGRLDELERRAVANGVPGVRRVGSGEMREIEPHAVGAAGLHSPITAIVDFARVAEAMAADLVGAGGQVHCSTRVTGIKRQAAATVVQTTGEDFVFDRLVLCAGLHADAVARLAGDDAEPRIVPFRGEYYRLRPAASGLVRGMIYPVPDPAYPFLGVHFTRRINGSVDVGPNAVLAWAREGYRRRDVNRRDLRDMLAYPGLWRLARRHWKTGAAEMHSSLSRAAFLRRARAYVPELSTADVEAAPAGVRAQALRRDGTLVDDFVFGGDDRFLTVRNAPSPAATSSLAIAEAIVCRLLGT
jgi:L-2-hydroxyglutarate oxidase LhgO